MAAASCRIDYRKADFFNAVQWAVGLELFLLINDPWRVFFTTDHPNGAPFTAYPDLFALLMDREVRAQWIETLPAEAMAVTTLASITREYTLDRDRDDDPRGAGQAAGPGRSRPSRRRRRAPMSRSTAPAGSRGRCSATRRWCCKDGDARRARRRPVTRYRFGRALHGRAGVRRRDATRLGRILRPASTASRTLLRVPEARARRGRTFETVACRD